MKRLKSSCLGNFAAVIDCLKRSFSAIWHCIHFCHCKSVILQIFWTRCCCRCNLTEVAVWKDTHDLRVTVAVVVRQLWVVCRLDWHHWWRPHLEATWRWAECFWTKEQRWMHPQCPPRETLPSPLLLTKGITDLSSCLCQGMSAWSKIGFCFIWCLHYKDSTCAVGKQKVPVQTHLPLIRFFGKSPTAYDLMGNHLECFT